MGTLLFEINPCIKELGAMFPESPYFSAEANTYREMTERNTSTLIARVQGNISGALTFSVLPDCKRLKIGLVEVHKNYFGRGLGVELLLEAERLERDSIYGCFGYLNNANNTYSKNMFLKAGYKQFDPWKFYK